MFEIVTRVSDLIVNDGLFQCLTESVCFLRELLSSLNEVLTAIRFVIDGSEDTDLNLCSLQIDCLCGGRSDRCPWTETWVNESSNEEKVQRKVQNSSSTSKGLE